MFFFPLPGQGQWLTGCLLVWGKHGSSVVQVKGGMDKEVRMECPLGPVLSACQVFKPTWVLWAFHRFPKGLRRTLQPWLTDASASSCHSAASRGLSVLPQTLPAGTSPRSGDQCPQAQLPTAWSPLSLARCLLTWAWRTPLKCSHLYCPRRLCVSQLQGALSPGGPTHQA